MSGVYDHPEYYDIAFDFRDIPAEVDISEACFERFARTKVKSVLELGSGNCPHMAEFIKRGYRYFGLDNNEAMIPHHRQCLVLPNGPSIIPIVFFIEYSHQEARQSLHLYAIDGILKHQFLSLSADASCHCCH